MLTRLRRVCVLAAALLAPKAVDGKDDGLALTPPMGWSSWYAFGADINETKIIEVADAMVTLGLRDAGYTYVNLDDGWMSPMRDRFGRLQGDLSRFPSGIKWLASQMHSRSLKLGLYGCVGVRTCLGFPGQFEHEYQDAQTIAEWGVDWWKHDNCWQKWATVETYANELIGDQYPGTAPAITALLDSTMYGLNIRGLSNEGQDAHPINYKNITGLPLATPDPSSAVDPPDGPGRFPAIMSSPRQHQIQQYEAYRLFGEALAATGRNVTYSICPLIAGCDASVWNYYKPYSHLSMNQCVQQDATDTFGSLLYHIDDNNRFPERAKAAGPGYWNDMDCLMLGYKELKKWMPRQSVEEYRSQVSMFAMLAAPLLFSADFRGTDPWNLATIDGHRNSTSIQTLLMNKELLKVSQDSLGVQGHFVKETKAAGGVAPGPAAPAGGAQAQQRAAAGTGAEAGGRGGLWYQVYSKKLQNGDVAVAVFNRGDAPAQAAVLFWKEVGIPTGKTVHRVIDVWHGKDLPVVSGSGSCTLPTVAPHDTLLLRVLSE